MSKGLIAILVALRKGIQGTRRDSGEPKLAKESEKSKAIGRSARPCRPHPQLSTGKTIKTPL